MVWSLVQASGFLFDFVRMAINKTLRKLCLYSRQLDCWFTAWLSISAVQTCQFFNAGERSMKYTNIIALLMLVGCGESEVGRQTKAGSQPNEEVDIAAVIEVNSRVMDELGRSAELMSDSSDILMRFSHFTDEHTAPVLLCPECSPESGTAEDLEIEDPEEIIPETMVQLLEDAKELHATALRFSNHLNLQQVALNKHLANLRAGQPDRKNQ